MGLVVGYFNGGGHRVDAQATVTDFPFGPGDTVDLQLELQDTGRNQRCVIETFRGMFVVCKTDGQTKVAFNLSKVVRARRIGTTSLF
jgi:ribosomal protein L19